MEENNESHNDQQNENNENDNKNHYINKKRDREEDLLTKYKNSLIIPGYDGP